MVEAALVVDGALSNGKSGGKDAKEFVFAQELQESMLPVFDRDEHDIARFYGKFLKDLEKGQVIGPSNFRERGMWGLPCFDSSLISTSEYAPLNDNLLEQISVGKTTVFFVRDALEKELNPNSRSNLKEKMKDIDTTKLSKNNVKRIFDLYTYMGAKKRDVVATLFSLYKKADSAFTPEFFALFLAKPHTNFVMKISKQNEEKNDSREKPKKIPERKIPLSTTLFGGKIEINRIKTVDKKKKKSLDAEPMPENESFYDQDGMAFI